MATLFDKNLGKLYLIPVTLGNSGNTYLPPIVLETVATLKFFFAEREKTARAVLKSFNYPFPIQEAELFRLDKNTKPEELDELFQTIYQGNSVGLLSEAGLPAIADPGAIAVRYAHEAGIQVVPLPGPSSIYLTLMASGLNGQQFTFNGYLPIKGNERLRAIKKHEQTVFSTKATQIFIETPYRNEALFKDLIKGLNSNTLLCIGTNLTLKDEQIITLPVSVWKKMNVPDFHKKPTVFAIGV